MSEVTPEYQAFVDKFKPKKTTDDCYTPVEVYEVVKAWVFRHYALRDGTQVIRPFWPGADYKRVDYPAGCLVLDNPPFSRLAEIEKYYLARKIDFFLFALGTSMYRPLDGLHYVHADAGIIYQNGAKVPTGFVTTLGSNLIETAPDLCEAIKTANKKETKTLPKYAYPMELVTAARMNWLAKHGVRYTVKAAEARFVRKLDNHTGKSVFGGGYLISADAAAERAAAECAAAECAAAERPAAKRITLSEREKKIVEELGGYGR